MSKDHDTLKARCPTCRKDVPYIAGQTNKYFPFCSRRCKLIDLGKWFDEEHRIEDRLRDRMPEVADDNSSHRRNDESDTSG